MRRRMLAVATLAVATLCTTVAAQSAFTALGVGRCVNSVGASGEYMGGFDTATLDLDACKRLCAQAPECGGVSFNDADVSLECSLWLTADLIYPAVYAGLGTIAPSADYTAGMDTTITRADAVASFGLCYRKDINTIQSGAGLPSTRQQCLDYAADIGLAPTNPDDIEAVCEPDETDPHGCAPMGCYVSMPLTGNMAVRWNGDVARTQNPNGIRECARGRACVRFPSPGGGTVGGTIYWTNTTANLLYNFSYVNWGCPRPDREAGFYDHNPGNFRTRAQQPDFQAEFPDFNRQTGMSLGEVDGIEDCVRLCAFMGAGGFQFNEGNSFCTFAPPVWIDQAGVTHPTTDPGNGGLWLHRGGGCNNENVHTYSLHALETASPTASPTTAPTASPVTSAPTTPPTSTAPTPSPTPGPTEAPTAHPTRHPTSLPTTGPSFTPTSLPTLVPTTSDPTITPTVRPTRGPSTSAPTSAPTTSAPTTAPTAPPTNTPTYTGAPTAAPTAAPSSAPTVPPTYTVAPTAAPTAAPSSSPTVPPTTLQSLADSGSPNDATSEDSDGSSTIAIVIGTALGTAAAMGLAFVLHNRRSRAGKRVPTADAGQLPDIARGRRAPEPLYTTIDETAVGQGATTASNAVYEVPVGNNPLYVSAPTPNRPHIGAADYELPTVTGINLQDFFGPTVMSTGQSEPDAGLDDSQYAGLQGTHKTYGSQNSGDIEV